MTATKVTRRMDDLRDGVFHFEQQVSATVWNVNHDLGRHPIVYVWDTAGTPVIGSVHYVDDNNITLTFSAAFAGHVQLV